MKRQFVPSHSISSVGWENNILEVEFKDGAIYKYYGVTKENYESLMNSASLSDALSKMEKTHAYQRIN